MRIAWSGRHIGRKLLPILLYALQRLSSRDGPAVELIVFGDGPETPGWKALTAQLGLAHRTRWTGWLPQREAMAALASADVLAFTGVQEGTPHVVLEALSLGLPVICHDACGMGAAVTSACGVKIPLRSPHVSIAGFADAVRWLARDGQAFDRLSVGALQRADELSWTCKARQIAAVYEQVVASDARTCRAAPRVRTVRER